MPYNSVKDLPKAQTDQYNDHQKEAFLKAFNNAYREYSGDEHRAFAVAHAAAKRAGERPASNGTRRRAWRARRRVLRADAGGSLSSSSPVEDRLVEYRERQALTGFAASPCPGTRARRPLSAGVGHSSSRRRCVGRIAIVASRLPLLLLASARSSQCHVPWRTNVWRRDVRSRGLALRGTRLGSRRPCGGDASR